MKDAQIQKAYEAAKERYAEIGVNTDAVLEQIAKVSLSLHCWQTDDVTGFENPEVFRLRATIRARPATSRRSARTSKRSRRCSPVTIV